jgi:hypothetical protein
MKTDHLLHRHGGRIVSLHAIEHITVDDRASYHFLGTLEFDNGGHERRAEIGPRDMIAEIGGSLELHAALHVLSEYLEARGTWTSNGWVPRTTHGRHDIDSESWELVP